MKIAIRFKLNSSSEARKHTESICYAGDDTGLEIPIGNCLLLFNQSVVILDDGDKQVQIEYNQEESGEYEQ